MGKYLVLILFLAGCQNQIEEPSQSNLLGVWKEIGYNTKIEIKEDEIIQLVGFPLVKGDKIVYNNQGSVLSCKYRNLMQLQDSFKLEIIALTYNVLKFKKVYYPLEYEIIFEKK